MHRDEYGTGSYISKRATTLNEEHTRGNILLLVVCTIYTLGAQRQP
jgi:hypothetical protein